MGTLHYFLFGVILIYAFCRSTAGNAEINECDSEPCKNGGQCADKVNGYTCTCQQGYEGSNCEIDINECDSEPCKNDGYCEDKVNGYTCSCQQGYTGINCETDINECVSGPCKNGGVCADKVNGYTCTCQKGYTETNCNTDINECASGPCKNGGSCADLVNGYTCTCHNGYTGINCATDVNECASEPCKNGGSCEDNVNGYTCTCQNGYTGINCETDIDECASGPCKNGGSCSDKVNKYTCTCQEGYKGINCETGVQCDPIGELYGGQVIYDSDSTEVGTSAYFECDDDFSLYPPDVDNSLCLANRTWFPEPPKCYKKAHAECPVNNTDCHGSFLLHHNQTKTIRCDTDYELYDVDNKVFLDKKEILITNINGTLKPGVPSCVEKRCFSTTLTHAVIKYANGSHADLKVLSGGERLDVSCEDRYELDSDRYRRLHKLSESVCCSKGKFYKFYKNCKEDKEATQCIEKSCPFEGYPSNMRTKRQRAGEFSRFLADDEYIEHGETIEYSCQNEEYELYVKETDEYLTEFSETCQHGNFSRPKQEFPLCQERGCEFPISERDINLCYLVSNSSSVCSNDTFKTASGSSLILKCKEGYELYENTNRTYTGEEWATLTCVKGKPTPELLCKPERCMLPSMQSNASTRMSKPLHSINNSHVDSGQSVALSCKGEDFELFVESTNTYLPNFQSTCIQGNFDKTLAEFPNCIEKRCVFQPISGVKYFTNDMDHPESNDAFTVESRSRINITCNPGFKLFSKRTTKHSREETATVGCIKGKLEEDITCLPGNLWPMIYSQVRVLLFRYEDTMSTFGCRFSLLSSQPCADSCFVHEIQHGWMQPSKSSNNPLKSDVKHGTMVQVRCDEDYQLVGSEELQCINGEWNNELPVCWYKPCEFNFVQGQLVLDKNNSFITPLEKPMKFPNGTQLNVMCLSGYSLNIVTADGYKQETSVSRVTSVCSSGSWMPLYTCLPKPCEIQFDYGQLVFNGQNSIISTPGLHRTFQNGTVLHIKCLSGYSLTVDNGTFDETSVSDVTSVCQTGSWKPLYKCFQGCKLSDNDSLLYKTVDGDNVAPESFIKHGTRLEVYCRYVHLGDYTYDDEADNEVEVPQVECSYGKLGQIDLKCKEGDPETCTTLPNGSVKRRFLNEYEVSCNEGYALNLMRPDIPYCECRDDRLVCHYGGQTPKCEPEPCTIPYSYDNRLSIFIRRGGNVVSLSGGVTVNVGDMMFFNCINTEFENYEPNNRRFKCKNGKWREDEKDKDWKLGYDGEFPLCRNTSCVPMCINGGKCIRDDRCQCPHLTSGASCDIVLCDAECKKNGGTCIAPGKCGNCPPRAYGNNCEHRECALPTHGPKAKSGKPSYQKGDIISPSEFDCGVGFIATPEIGITCLDEGKWSDTPKCLSGCKPPGIPGVKNSNKTFYHEGDKIDSSELFCLRGQVLFPKGDIKCLKGGNWTETAKCQRGCFPPDGTPPMKTHEVFYQTGEVIATDNFLCPFGHFATPKDGMRCESGYWSTSVKCIHGCTLPHDIPQLKQKQKPVYAIDERITSSEFVCNFPSVLSSTTPMICMEGGQWNETIKCGCSPPVHASPLRTQKQFYNTGEIIVSSEFECDSSSIAMPEKGMMCMEGGHWTEPVNCIQDKAGCSLPFGDTFLYRSIEGDSINPGSFIRNGTKVNVSCQYIEPDYDYNVDMADNETDDSVSHVQCLNGQLGNISLKCKTVPETCTTLANGSAKRKFMNEYEVSCDEGYALNLMRPDIPYCECKDDKLVCRYGGQTPECKPVPCKIPESFDSGLTIHVQGEERDISLSSGVQVDVGENVIFSCTHTDVQYFEPNNRRFKCENGKWLEAETEQKWDFGNKGEFPKCRNTTCEPHCKNDGKCIRDDTCECPHHTSGKRCENVVGCKLPHDAAPVKNPKQYYNVGEKIPASNFECDSSSTALPGHGMTCLVGGSWTETVMCKTIQNRLDDCFQYRSKFYPFIYKQNRTDEFVIGTGITMTEKQCKMECLQQRDKTCNGVFHFKVLNENSVLQYYTCWGFEEDKRYPQFYKDNGLPYGSYYFRTCL